MSITIIKKDHNTDYDLGIKEYCNILKEENCFNNEQSIKMLVGEYEYDEDQKKQYKKATLLR